MLNKSSTLSFTTLASLLLLAACDSDSGGAAGDTDDDLIATALLAPFTGIYELEDGWKGEEGDRGILTIDTPGADGTSEAQLFDYDDIDNCVPTRPSTGVVRKDDFSNRVFMDDIIQFDEAVLSLSGSELTIEFSDDFDIDDDSQTTEVSITAERVDVASISDLGPDC